MQPPDSRQRWVSFDEARMILRMSEGTLRRAIRDGKVTAEQRRRNPDSDTDQRMVYEVLISDPPASATSTESEQPPSSAIQAPDAMLPYLEALTDTHAQLIEAYREIGALRERAASAESDANHETARANAAEARAAQLAADLERAQRPWWRRLLG